jgi:D-lactate dehydrogenase
LNICRRKSTASLTWKLYYGHFFCHVFHQDYIVKKGVDTTRLRADAELLRQRGAQYPAEHNVGHFMKRPII